jgi:hypothetical protein
MPEGINLKEMLSQAAGNEPTPVADPVTPPVTDPVTPPVTDPVTPPVTDPITDPLAGGTPPAPVENPDKPGFDMEGKPYVAPAADPDPDPDPAPKPNPMKEIRDTLAKEKAAKELVTNTINKYATGKYPDVKFADHMKEDGSGIDYESLSVAMEKVDVAVRAGTAGLTPEVQAAVEKLEAEKIQLQKDRLQVSMDKGLNNLQIEKSLKEAELNQFFADAMKGNKNPYQWIAQGGTLGDLYDIIYVDKIQQRKIDAAVAAAKATWEAAQANTAPKVNPGIPNPAGVNVVKDGMTLDEMKAAAALQIK